MGVFGPLRVQEVRNLDNLYKQGKIIMKIVSILNNMKFEYEGDYHIFVSDRFKLNVKHLKKLMDFYNLISYSNKISFNQFQHTA